MTVNRARAALPLESVAEQVTFAFPSLKPTVHQRASQDTLTDSGSTESATRKRFALSADPRPGRQQGKAPRPVSLSRTYDAGRTVPPLRL